MATGDNDIEALLAEVDRTLSGRPPAADRTRAPAPAARRGSSASEQSYAGGRLSEMRRRVRVAAFSSGIGAAVVFALFAVIPLLGALSGAAGAAIATFVVVLVLARRR